MITKACTHCGETEDLRPYGPGGSWVCFPCGTRPENEAETLRNFFAQLDAAQAALPEGGRIILGEESGPRPEGGRGQ